MAAAEKKQKSSKRKEHQQSPQSSKNSEDSEHWTDALISYVSSPTKHADMIVSRDDPESKAATMTIVDKYPKAKHHLLIIPLDKTLLTFAKLERRHVALLEHMVDVGHSAISSLCAKDTTLRFRLGFHAVPSMKLIHLHCISQDFQSDFMSHKKHYNSFVTDFFVDPNTLIQQLNDTGKVFFDQQKYEAYLKADLRCTRIGCSERVRSMLTLKKHLASCTKPFSGNVS